MLYLASWHEAQMTLSIAATLQRLRGEVKGYVLRVNALCINQSDDAERSQQVGLMRQIY